jgi:hypothetical protein
MSTEQSVIMYLHTEVIIIFICNGKYLTIVKKVFTTNHYQIDCIVGGYPKIQTRPPHKRRMYANVQVKAADDIRGDKGSPKNCSCLKSCESFYTCPHAPFYRETKGLLHSDNTLELKEYS